MIGGGEDGSCDVATKSLTNRVAMLEKQMQDLAELPDRTRALEVQFLQLRAEMQAGFSALRASDEDTRRYMRVLHEEVLARIAQLGER
jgi:hypothetical protein